jgi:hypothetical protein
LSTKSRFVVGGLEGNERQREKQGRDNKMGKGNRGYILAAILGALGGGAVVGLATKAIPKMMAGMMRNMMRHMGDNGCDPTQM